MTKLFHFHGIFKKNEIKSAKRNPTHAVCIWTPFPEILNPPLVPNLYLLPFFVQALVRLRGCICSSGHLLLADVTSTINLRVLGHWSCLHFLPFQRQEFLSETKADARKKRIPETPRPDHSNIPDLRRSFSRPSFISNKKNPNPSTLATVRAT